MIPTARTELSECRSCRSPQPHCKRRVLWHPICQVPIIAVVSIRVVCRMYVVVPTDTHGNSDDMCMAKDMMTSRLP